MRRRVQPFPLIGVLLACTSVFALVRLDTTHPTQWPLQAPIGLSGLAAVLLAWAGHARNNLRAAIRSTFGMALLVATVFGAFAISAWPISGSANGFFVVDSQGPRAYDTDGYDTSTVGIGNSGRTQRASDGETSSGGFTPENQTDLVTTVVVGWSVLTALGVLLAPLLGVAGRYVRRFNTRRGAVWWLAFLTATIPLWIAVARYADHREGLAFAVSLASLAWLSWALLRTSYGADVDDAPVT